MTLAPGSNDVERFRYAIAERLGLWFDDNKLDYLANVLDSRLAASEATMAAYLSDLEDSARGRPELGELARVLTVGETYFFRHPDQFRALSLVALPERMAARASVRQLRLLSAGCSSGDEAYSMSILTQQILPDPSWSVSVVGIDINRDILERAARGCYSAWSLRETPEAIRKRYFVAEGGEFVLADSVRRSVELREESLIAETPWPQGSLDVVFCRNVLMYFTPEQAARAVHKLAEGLAPGGYLFLGSAETLRGVSDAFDLCHTHATFYYRRKAAGAHTHASTVGHAAHVSKQALAVLPTPPAPAQPSVELGCTLELLAQERFSEALAALDIAAPDTSQNADAALLRAALLTHGGNLEAAELACAELIRIDALSSGAHYLQALCRERNGDLQAAGEHSQTASYLDPGFAMPRLHLGLMARKAGDHGTARRELRQATLLLQREEASRVLLFGGGFDRNGLIALCRLELEQLGERK